MPGEFRETSTGTIVLVYSGVVSTTEVRTTMGRLVKRLRAGPVSIVADVRGIDTFDPINHFVAAALLRRHARNVKDALVVGAETNARFAAQAAALLVGVNLRFSATMPPELENPRPGTKRTSRRAPPESS